MNTYRWDDLAVRMKHEFLLHYGAGYMTPIDIPITARSTC